MRVLEKLLQLLLVSFEFGLEFTRIWTVSPALGKNSKHTGVGIG